MTARKLDGKAVAAAIRADLADRVGAVKAGLGRPPCLAIVLVGDDPASHVYVKSKLKTAQESGMDVRHESLPDTASLGDVLSLVRRFNDDAGVDGILVQSPLPAAMGTDAAQRVFDAIDPQKDVDGFTPRSTGLLSQGRNGFVPCTPAGIVEMLDRLGIDVTGMNAVVVGRSDIVGKPMAMLLLHRDATVTICHSRTRDLPAVCRAADLLVAAVGHPAMIMPDYVKPGAIVIDVGINRVTDAAVVHRILRNFPKRIARFEEKGSALIGDVHPDAAEVAGAMTPVPGGVGPLTIAMLMVNTVRAAELKIG